MNEPATPELGCVFIPIFAAIFAGVMIGLGAPVGEAVVIAACATLALFGVIYWVN